MSKKVFLGMFLILLGTSGAYGQCTFPSVWKSDFSNKADFLIYASQDGSQIIGTTRKDVCVLDGTTGKPIWSAKLSDVADVKKTDIQKYMEEAGVLFIGDKKMGKDVIMCLDTKTGKFLWQSSDFEDVNLGAIIYMPKLKSFAIITKRGLDMVDARTGKINWTVSRFKGAIAKYVYDEAANKLVLVNYKSGLGALLKGFENQIMQINTTDGHVDWVSNYEGVVETKLITGETIVGLTVSDNHVLLMLNGLEAFDRQAGRLIWKTHYDVSLNRGIGGSTQMYDAVADPLVVGNDVYIVNFSSTSRKKVLQKFNLNSGEKEWESDKIAGNKIIIPNIYYAGNTVILQIGGYVNIQGTQHTQNMTTYYSKWKWEGPFGLQAFDAATGQPKWKSDKFKNAITNIVPKGNKLFAADGKNIYSIDAVSGNTISKVAVKTGAPMTIFNNDNNIIVLGEKGIAAYKNDDMANIYTFKAKDVSMNSEFDGSNFFLVTSDEIIGLNLSTGQEKGHYKISKGTKWGTTSDGEYFFVMGKKGVGKYKVNGS